MSKALDKLEAAVNKSVKDGSATKNMTRDQLLDYMFSQASTLRTHLQVFEDLGQAVTKLQAQLTTLSKNSSNLPSVKSYQKLMKGLTGSAKLHTEQAFLGAVVESAQATVAILDEVSVNIDKLFVDKSFNLYNTKISHIAVYGVLDGAEVLARYLEAFMDAFTSDKKPEQIKLAPYQKKYLEDKTDEVAAICNRMINGRMNKTFTASLLKYKQSGNDVSVLSSNNESSSKFAKLDGNVNEDNVSAGCRGIHIFRAIGDFIVDWFDARARKQRALRDQHKARVEFLQMELEGEDPNSERYKRIVKIIQNYQVLIDRLNQKLDEYYSED